MKKILSILVCVCVLLSAMVFTASAADVSNVVLTVDTLGLESNAYSAGTNTVDGVAFEWVQLGNYGDGIQIRDKADKGTSMFWNTDAFGSAIKEIKLVYSDSKSTYDNPDAEILYFGNEAGTYSYTTTLSTVKGTKEYTVTPDAETYTFFKFEHDYDYTAYWKSITIVLVGGEEVTPPAGGGDEGGDVTPPAGDEDDKPVELPAPDATNTLTVKEAIELGAAQDTSAYTADKYYVTGKITAVSNTQYGNMYIADEDGNEILIYGTYGADGKDRYDALASKPDEGDTVTFYGVVGNYNGTPQLKNAWIIEFTAGELDVEAPTEPEADSVLTIEEAIELGLTKRSNEFTTNKYYVTGVITEIYNEEYGNMKITDDAGNILTLYGTWEVLDEIRFDAMENKPAVGDTITVYGVIGQYNGTPQMKNGVFTTAPVTDDDNDDTTTGDNTTGGTTGGNANTDNSTTSPSTSDNVGAIVAMAVAAAAVLVASKKR